MFWRKSRKPTPSPGLCGTGNSDGSQQLSTAVDNDPFAVFLTPEAHAINIARQAHLASLGLDLEHKQVLEVGAGIGLHTPFFLKRGCEVLVADGNAENVGEIRRRLSNVPSALLDIEQDGAIDDLGTHSSREFSREHEKCDKLVE
jgi:hypothetical protein